MSGHLEDDGLDWTVHLDDESGKYFLYNNVTNETKWATAEDEALIHQQLEGEARVETQEHEDKDAVDALPAGEEVNKYSISDICQAIGLDEKHDEELIHLAKELKLELEAPLPFPWKEVEHEDESVYYYNFMTAETTWDHPSLPKFIDRVHEEKKMRDSNYTKAKQYCRERLCRAVFDALKLLFLRQRKIRMYAAHYSHTVLLKKNVHYWRSYTHAQKTIKYKYKMFYFRNTICRIFTAWRHLAKELGDRNPSSRIARKFSNKKVSEKVFRAWKDRTKVMSKIRRKKNRKISVAKQFHGAVLKKKIFNRFCDAVIQQKGYRAYLIFQCFEKKLFPNMLLSMYEINMLLCVNRDWSNMVMAFFTAQQKYSRNSLVLPPRTMQIEVKAISKCRKLRVLTLKHSALCDADILTIAKSCVCVEDLNVADSSVRGGNEFKNALLNHWLSSLRAVSLRGCPIKTFDSIDILLNCMPNMIRLNAGPKIMQQKIKRGRKISKYKNQSEFFCRYSRRAENRSVNSASIKVVVFAGVRTNLLEMIKLAKGLALTLRMLDISWTRIFSCASDVSDLLRCLPALMHFEYYGSHRPLDEDSSIIFNWKEIEKRVLCCQDYEKNRTEVESHHFLPPVPRRKEISNSPRQRKKKMLCRSVHRQQLRVYENGILVEQLFASMLK
eukprot:g13130.t1